jgi:serine/threonine protein kinase
VTYLLYRVVFLAERHLKEASKVDGHPLSVVRLIETEDASNLAIRHAAAVHFKNIVKEGWDINKEDGNKTNEQVAVKSIDRFLTDQKSFQREVRAMQYVLHFGGHPHIVSLHTYFKNDDDFFHIVMDYIPGGRMFDYLIENWTYSEADAARLVREVASCGFL